ncbi:hypothetical protein BC828DRAFT_414671 [Blastocladiella britannica]|nr:hypothetical protein BC828DRAFT_414671 [Blastocladiella britannica]
MPPEPLTAATPATGFPSLARSAFGTLRKSPSTLPPADPPQVTGATAAASLPSPASTASSPTSPASNTGTLSPTTTPGANAVPLSAGIAEQLLTLVAPSAYIPPLLTHVYHHKLAGDHFADFARDLATEYAAHGKAVAKLLARSPLSSADEFPPGSLGLLAAPWAALHHELTVDSQNSIAFGSMVVAKAVDAVRDACAKDRWKNARAAESRAVKAARNWEEARDKYVAGADKLSDKKLGKLRAKRDKERASWQAEAAVAFNSAQALDAAVITAVASSIAAMAEARSTSAASVRVARDAVAAEAGMVSVDRAVQAIAAMAGSDAGPPAPVKVVKRGWLSGNSKDGGKDGSKDKDKSAGANNAPAQELGVPGNVDADGFTIRPDEAAVTPSEKSAQDADSDADSDHEENGVPDPFAAGKLKIAIKGAPEPPALAAATGGMPPPLPSRVPSQNTGSGMAAPVPPSLPPRPSSAASSFIVSEAASRPPSNLSAGPVDLFGGSPLHALPPVSLPVVNTNPIVPATTAATTSGPLLLSPLSGTSAFSSDSGPQQQPNPHFSFTTAALAATVVSNGASTARARGRRSIAAPSGMHGTAGENASTGTFPGLASAQSGGFPAVGSGGISASPSFGGGFSAFGTLTLSQASSPERHVPAPPPPAFNFGFTSTPPPPLSPPPAISSTSPSASVAAVVPSPTQDAFDHFSNFSPSPSSNNNNASVLLLAHNEQIKLLAMDGRIVRLMVGGWFAMSGTSGPSPLPPSIGFINPDGMSVADAAGTVHTTHRVSLSAPSGTPPSGALYARYQGTVSPNVQLPVTVSAPTVTRGPASRALAVSVTWTATHPSVTVSAVALLVADAPYKLAEADVTANPHAAVPRAADGAMVLSGSDVQASGQLALAWIEPWAREESPLALEVRLELEWAGALASVAPAMGEGARVVEKKGSSKLYVWRYAISAAASGSVTDTDGARG